MKAAKNPPTTLLVYLAAAVKNERNSCKEIIPYPTILCVCSTEYNLQDKNETVRKNRYFDVNLVAMMHLVLSCEEEEQRA